MQRNDVSHAAKAGHVKVDRVGNCLCNHLHEMTEKFPFVMKNNKIDDRLKYKPGLLYVVLAIVTISTLGVWIAYKFRVANVQQRHVNNLAMHGAEAVYGKLDLPSASVARITGVWRTELDEWLGINFFNKVCRLEIDNPKFSNQDMDFLLKLPDTQSVIFVNSKITDTGLARLQDLPKLQHLALWNAKISDDGIESLKCFPVLRNVDIMTSGVSNNCLKYLSSLRQLEHLRLSVKDLNDQGLAELQKLQQLKSLTIISVDSQITDDGLHSLSNLSQMKSLKLFHVAVTNKGVRYIAKMKGLQTLELTKSSVTNEAIEGLKILNGVEVIFR